MSKISDFGTVTGKNLILTFALRIFQNINVITEYFRKEICNFLIQNV